MAAFFDTYDFLIAPVSQVPPFPVEQPYVTEIAGQPMPDYLAWMRSAYWISVLHAPAASVPCGFTAGGLPVGVQIVGRPWADLEVLRLAHAFERAAAARRARPPVPRRLSRARLGHQPDARPDRSAMAVAADGAAVLRAPGSAETASSRPKTADGEQRPGQQHALRGHLQRPPLLERSPAVRRRLQHRGPGRRRRPVPR